MLTQDYVRRLFDYNPFPLTGVVIWKISRTNRFPAGTVAGGITRLRSGYARRYVYIDSRSYPIHRIIWLYVYGVWPRHEIDHRDGDGLNNRLSNLREATRTQNCTNIPQRQGTVTGYKGVQRNGDRWYWCCPTLVSSVRSSFDLCPKLISSQPTPRGAIVSGGLA